MTNKQYWKKWYEKNKEKRKESNHNYYNTHRRYWKERMKELNIEKLGTSWSEKIYTLDLSKPENAEYLHNLVSKYLHKDNKSNKSRINDL